MCEDLEVTKNFLYQKGYARVDSSLVSFLACIGCHHSNGETASVMAIDEAGCVSKDTGHGIVLQLEERGILTREYVEVTEKRGRPRILINAPSMPIEVVEQLQQHRPCQTG